ncbi:MAG: hypothetical protein HQK75_12445 [Candidatus Magnetomorum sp.]|nr:hypothetical protein [Candidatus Magnetomorum sp.]
MIPLIPSQKMNQFIIRMILFCLWFPSTIFANVSRTQTISLKSGWNAIFLEVFPDKPDPDVIFANTPVTQVLTFIPENSSIQFIKDPDEIEWKKDEWLRWLPPHGPESFLKNLFALINNQAYLIFSLSDYTLNITGTSYIIKQKWLPDNYNLTGFYVDPTAPPTFAQYFSGSPAHRQLNVYTLINSTWKHIENPEQVNIESGKAYWVYCDNSSQYAGPLEINLPGAGNELNFRNTIPQWDITIVNRSTEPLSFTVTPIPNSITDAGVPLSIVSYTDNTHKIFTPFDNQTSAIAIETGESVKFRLSIRRNDIYAPTVSSLLKFSDDLGNRFFLPVRAEQ